MGVTLLLQKARFQDEVALYEGSVVVVRLLSPLHRPIFLGHVEKVVNDWFLEGDKRFFLEQELMGQVF